MKHLKSIITIFYFNLYYSLGFIYFFLPAMDVNTAAEFSGLFSSKYCLAVPMSASLYVREPDKNYRKISDFQR